MDTSTVPGGGSGAEATSCGSAPAATSGRWKSLGLLVGCFVLVCSPWVARKQAQAFKALVESNAARLASA